MTISDTVTNGVVRDRMLSLKGIMRVRSILAVLLLASFALGYASPANAQATRSDPDPIDPEVLSALYSLDFEVAEAKSQELVDRDPSNPRLWNLLASSIWLKIVYQQEKLSLDSYMGNRLGGERSNEGVEPAVERRLREVLGRAITLAEAALEEDPDAIEALYAKGVAYGTLASFEATVKRAYLAANRAAKTARESHLKVLQLDPSYNDARLTIGTYDYALGVLPGFLRFLLGFIGIRGGDKESGIEQLEYAAELGERNQTNAKMVLVVVYNREREYEKSLDVLKELHAEYPRNFLLETAKASVYERLELWDDAVETYEGVLAKVRSGEDDYDRLDPEPLMFKIGENLIRSDSADTAHEMFSGLSESDNPDVAGRAFLWIGKIHDSRNERSRALAAYEAVLGLDCSEDLKREANQFKRRAYTGD